MKKGGSTRKVNKALKDWVTFVKKVQKEENLPYKQAMSRAKTRKNKGEKWQLGGNTIDVKLLQKTDDMGFPIRKSVKEQMHKMEEKVEKEEKIVKDELPDIEENKEKNELPEMEEKVEKEEKIVKDEIAELTNEPNLEHEQKIIGGSKNKKYTHKKPVSHKKKCTHKKTVSHKKA